MQKSIQPMGAGASGPAGASILPADGSASADRIPTADAAAVAIISARNTRRPHPSFLQPYSMIAAKER
jgi:hypothetical protein